MTKVNDNTEQYMQEYTHKRIERDERDNILRFFDEEGRIELIQFANGIFVDISYPEKDKYLEDCIDIKVVSWSTGYRYRMGRKEDGMEYIISTGKNSFPLMPKKYFMLPVNEMLSKLHEYAKG